MLQTTLKSIILYIYIQYTHLCYSQTGHVKEHVSSDILNIYIYIVQGNIRIKNIPDTNMYFSISVLILGLINYTTKIRGLGPLLQLSLISVYIDTCTDVHRFIQTYIRTYIQKHS